MSARRLSRAALLRRDPPEEVYGLRFAPPRPTAEGWRRAIVLFGPPALGFVLALDLLVWAIAEAAFGACTAVWCLF